MNMALNAVAAAASTAGKPAMTNSAVINNAAMANQQARPARLSDELMALNNRIAQAATARKISGNAAATFKEAKVMAVSMRRCAARGARGWRA